jgi:hypothetical protein
MINATTARVPVNTAAEVNERIRRDTEKRLAYYAAHPELIDQRLAELDREWDVERLIEVEAPTMSLTGLLLGMTLGRKWLVIPLFAQSMVFLHALQGWYPLLPLFRRMGIRTEREIAIERYALKAMRGDFKEVVADQPEKALQVTR